MDAKKLLSQTETSLRAFLISHLRDPSDVDDVMQEVAVKVLLKFDSVKSEDRFEAWLFRIARNAMVDRFRKATREQSLIKDILWGDDKSEYHEHIFEQCVQPFLDALPENDRKLLRAVELEGVSQKRYARELGISYSTLKSRVQASRNRLRRAFDKCCDTTRAGDGTIIDASPKSRECQFC